MFAYDPVHGVVVCCACRSCVVLGEALKETVQLLSSHEPKTIRELRDQARDLRAGSRCAAIEGLATYDGLCCLYAQCAYSTRHLPKMKEHTYFAGKGLIDYFVVVVDSNKKEEGKANTGELLAPLEREEKALFTRLEEDYQEGVKGDAEEQASIVHDFADSRDDEIRSSYKLLPKKEVEGGAEGATDPDLARILAAAEAMLRDAYKLCSDTSPGRRMTQQRASILNEFYAGASGKADGFRHFKNPSTLVTYFTTMKQLLVYYYRVVHCEGGHFTRARPGQVLPGDVMRPTKTQTSSVRARSNFMASTNLMPRRNGAPRRT
ncbi:hypothetical protein VF21_09869 [Pseudogymnoascus sp. 05NY08]|nr:hypothetical protein VF21_09869 [Pseudogymnoascus sp. 05NY08]